MRKIAVLFLILFAPMAYGQVLPHNGGTAICSPNAIYPGNCTDASAQQNFMKRTAVENLNCSGHGFTRNPNGASCPLQNGSQVKVNLVYNGNVSTHYFAATELDIPANSWNLTPIIADGPSTLRVYYQSFCIGVYVETFSTATAALVPGGVSVSLHIGGSNEMAICWALAAEGSQ